MTPDNREQEMHGFPTGEARPTYDDIPSEDDDDDISEGLNQPGMEGSDVSLPITPYS